MTWTWSRTSEVCPHVILHSFTLRVSLPLQSVSYTLPTSALCVLHSPDMQPLSLACITTGQFQGWTFFITPGLCIHFLLIANPLLPSIINDCKSCNSSCNYAHQKSTLNPWLLVHSGESTTKTYYIQFWLYTPSEILICMISISIFQRHTEYKRCHMMLVHLLSYNNPFKGFVDRCWQTMRVSLWDIL